MLHSVNMFILNEYDVPQQKLMLISSIKSPKQIDNKPDVVDCLTEAGGGELTRFFKGSGMLVLATADD